jgi:hypothetical protein
MMRDFPIFATDNGAGSVILKEVPYTGKAYIKIASAEDAAAFLEECLEFCAAVGAVSVYATGHMALEKYPLSAVVITMSREKKEVPPSNAVLVQVTADKSEAWRQLYNQKMQSVDNAAYITIRDMSEIVKAGTAWFVVRDGMQIGIGIVEDNWISTMAATVKGGGTEVLSALCAAITDGPIHLQVAQSNHKALALYREFGFRESEGEIKWYKIV